MNKRFVIVPKVLSPCCTKHENLKEQNKHNNLPKSKKLKKRTRLKIRVYIVKRLFSNDFKFGFKK